MEKTVETNQDTPSLFQPTEPGWLLELNTMMKVAMTLVMCVFMSCPR